MPNSRTRLKLAISIGVFVAALALIGVFKSMEMLSTTCVGGLLTIGGTYIWGETKRPSSGESPNPLCQ